MLRLTVFLKRNPELSVEEFRTHWRDVHGPLIAGNPDLARHIVRYEQHLPADVGGLAGTEGYDGIAVQWLESIDAFTGFMNEPAYMEQVHPDEERFLDRDGLVWMVTDEPNVVIAGG